MREISETDWAIVRQLALFSGLDDATLRQLLTHAVIEAVPNGTVVFHQDDPAKVFYAVLQGWVTLTRESADGNPTVIGVFTTGESFAEAAILSSQRYPVTARVVEDARLLAIPANEFLSHLRTDANIAINMLASMSRHMRHLVTQIEQQRAKSAPQRLGDFLLRLHPAQDHPSLIRLPYDKSILAGRLGMKPETLSRALARLRDIGVKTQGKDLLVTDFDALKKFTGSELGG
jgi:CRP/FNR family transcriptional regulator, dissimilatory nitrate respiration regulator